LGRFDLLRSTLRRADSADRTGVAKPRQRPDGEPATDEGRNDEMSAQRRPVSRRSGAGPAARSRGPAAVETLDDQIVDDAVADEPLIDEPMIDEPLDDGPRELTAAEIRAQRAEERRYRAEEPTQQSVLGERFGALGRVYADTRAEVKKITWPDRETTRNLTIVVIGISVVLGVVLGGIDYILFQIFEAIP
jgi:preprotein translocase subunit SecE